ncbi:MAG: histidine phosphatase family protein [Bacteroidales bacterium]
MFILVRHGQSESNAGLPTLHPETIELTELGRAQAGLTAVALPRPSLIATSSYRRAQATAEPFQGRWPAVSTVVWPVHEFTFLDPAHWSGTTTSERRDAVNAYWERADPLYVDGPGCESLAQLFERAMDLRRLVGTVAEEPVVMFTHAMFIRAFAWAVTLGRRDITGDGMRKFREFSRAFSLPNCSILAAETEARAGCQPVSVEHLPAQLLSE